jgi:hypothetical protein
VVERPLYPIRRRHLEDLGTTLGIWQHATGTKPDPRFGFCTDDVARALTVDLLHQRGLGWEAVEASAWIWLTFLLEAFNERTGRFRNFRSAGGAWLEAAGSQDSQARALAALGQAVAESPDAGFVEQSASLFERALPAASELIELRPVAAAIVGCDAALSAGVGNAVRSVFDRLTARLAGAVAGLSSDWPWPEPKVTYENALIPDGLIVAGTRLGDDSLVATGRQTLDWLADAQTASAGYLSLIGNRGWWPRGEIAARFDQQPIDAAAMVVAADDAFTATSDRRYLDLAERAYGWFLGDNDLGVRLADPGTGGCADGLTPGGVNANQGAESTLMWLTALERIRRLRAATRPVGVGSSVLRDLAGDFLIPEPTRGRR